MFRTFGKRESFVVDIAGLILTVAGIGIFAMVFIGSSVKRHDSLEDQRLQLEMKTAYVDQLESVLHIGSTTNDTLIAFVETSKYDFPAELNFPELFNDIAGYARQCNVKLMQVEPGESNNQGKYTEMTVAITAASSFIEVCDFLYEIEGMSRLVKLESLKITPDINGSVCNIHLVVSIFANPGAGVIHGD